MTVTEHMEAAQIVRERRARKAARIARIENAPVSEGELEQADFERSLEDAEDGGAR